MSINLNNVLSGNKVSTFRVTWTRENVTFANNCFNTNGRDMTQCPVTLGYQDYIDQQDNTAQARINDGIQAEETLAWFIPGKGGDHDVKFGLQYPYSAAYNTNQGNLNGTFSFGRSNAVFNPAIPSTYPDRLTVRVGGPNVFYQKAHYVAGFAQDKWRLGNNFTLNLGVRYDLEMLPLDTQDDMFVGDDHPRDSNNIAPRFGLTYDLGGTSVIRAGIGRFYDKTHFEVIGGLYTGTPYAISFIVNFPTAAADNGPRNGQLPTDPFLVNGPVLNRTLLNQLYPGGQLLRNTGATWDNPDRIVPRSDEISIGYERQLGAVVSASVDVPALARPRPVRAAQSQPAGAHQSGGGAVDADARAQPGAGDRDAAAGAEVSRLHAVHDQRDPVRERGRERLQRADGAVEEALQQQLQPAGVVHAGQGDRQRRRQRRAVEQLPGRQRAQPRSATKGRRISTTATTSPSAARR